jgi:hypothetical protein
MGSMGQVGERAFLWTMVRNQVCHVVQPHVVGRPTLVFRPLFKNPFVQQPDCQARAARKWLELLYLELPLTTSQQPLGGNETAYGGPYPPPPPCSFF